MIKKLLPLLLCFCLLASITGTASAAPVEVPPTQQEGRTFVIPYDTGDSANAGSQYILLIVAMPKTVTDAAIDQERVLGELDVDSILYIDQAAANESGVVTFNGFGDGLQLKRYTNADVYVGGGDLAAPTHIGYIKASGVTASGTITFYGSKTGATVTLIDPETKEVVTSTTTKADGTYETDKIAPGNYTLQVKKKGHCLVTWTTVNVDGDTAINRNIKDYVGDMDNSGNVNIRDISPILYDFGNPPTVDGVDIDENGTVNIRDLSPVLYNFGVGMYQKGVVLD